MSRLFSETVFGIPWTVIAVLALGIAVAYVVVDTGAGADGFRWIILRWFHPVCWLLLCLAALSKAKVTPIPVEWAAMLGALGGACYLVFAIFWFTRGR